MSLIINKDGGVSMSVTSAAGNNGMLLTDKKNLNDGKWHFVDVSHAKTRLAIEVLTVGTLFCLR